MGRGAGASARSTRQDHFVTRPRIRHWRIESASRPGEFRTVTQDICGEFGCDCPAWMLRRSGEKTVCRHIQEVWDNNLQSLEGARMIPLDDPRPKPGAEASALEWGRYFADLSPEVTAMFGAIKNVRFLGDEDGLLGIEVTGDARKLVLNYEASTSRHLWRPRNHAVRNAMTKAQFIACSQWATSIAMAVGLLRQYP